jgi:hypothetical protein
VSKRKKEAPSAGRNPSATALGPVQPRSSPEFAPDYSYVRKDLRRIAFIAGGILAALLVLAIILN